MNTDSGHASTLPETGSYPDEWVATKTLEGCKAKEFANVFFLYILRCNMIFLLEINFHLGYLRNSAFQHPKAE